MVEEHELGGVDGDPQYFRICRRLEEVLNDVEIMLPERLWPERWEKGGRKMNESSEVLFEIGPEDLLNDLRMSFRYNEVER